MMLPASHMLRDVVCYGMPATDWVNLGGSLKIETPFTNGMTKAKNLEELATTQQRGNDRHSL